MAFLALRGVTCALCGCRFELLLPDLLPPGPFVCDVCLVDVWCLDTEVLRRHVAKRLGERTSQNRTELEALLGAEGLERRVVHYLQGLKEQWADAEEAIRHREAQRGAGGASWGAEGAST